MHVKKGKNLLNYYILELKENISSISDVKKTNDTMYYYIFYIYKAEIIFCLVNFIERK